MFQQATIRKVILTVIMVTIASSAPVRAQDDDDHPIDPALYQALEWREVGPYRGGRVTTATGVPSQPNVYYMGATGGGVWKTTNAGASWQNISDEYFKVGSIGAVAVSLSDPNVVYAGTGESPIRGVTTSHGDGVWKSTDAGKTWTHMGLAATRQISKIRLHPTNPDIAYVAAQGNPWGANEERGVYRTRDGGATWEQVLAADENTGAADLSMDANNPRILYAAMWDHQRTPWFIRSGGPGGGLYKTTDGGDTWEKLEGGLPDLVGKIGVAVSPANSERVYAIVEAEDGGLYRSDNAGKSWSRINPDRVIQARAWYYNHITADTQDENTVWIMNAPLLKSIDGGKSFTPVDTPHGDHHDHWIHPDNNRIMINANDGGATVTFDGGKTWSREDNQPTAQFYRVATDNRFPYYIYGGQQDNSTVAIASRSFEGGIGREDYYDVGGGESAHIVFDPDHPRLVYATTINTTLTEYDAETRRTRPIKPYPEYTFGRDPKDHKYRANWNAPLAISPHDYNVIYYGAQVLLRSNDRGLTWQEISPDLTRNEEEKQSRNGGPITNEQAGAETYNTIFYIVESPHEAGAIWVGSDDGLVHLTRNGGGNWANVTPRGLGEAQINAIEISPHDPTKAYIAVAGYKMNDFTPAIYKTENYGRSWRKIVDGLPADTFVRVVREDPERAGLLYAGTEAGMFVSFDDGGNWQPLQLNLPPVPVTDLTLRQGDLVAATQGRGFWVLDNPAPLRQISEDFADTALHLYAPANAYRMSTGGSGEFQGKNPPSGAVIYYYLAADPGGDTGPVTFEILDNAGTVIRTERAEDNDRNACMVANSDPRNPLEIKLHEPKQGMNRWVWDLRWDGFACIDHMRMFAGWQGARVMPGDYQVRVSAAGETAVQSFTVLADPRVDIPADQFAELDGFLAEVTGLMTDLQGRLERLRASRDQALRLAELTEGHARHGEIKAAAEAIDAQVKAWEEQVIQPRHETFEDDINWPNMLDVQIVHLLRASDSADAPVTEGARTRLADLKAEWAALTEDYGRISSEDIAAFNSLLQSAGIGPVVAP